MITIIIPTFNRAYALEKVLESYYGEEFINEIIIVDDAGDDNSREIVEVFSKKYPNILTKYIRHSEKKGASGCRKTGYEIALSEYVLFGEDDVCLASNYTRVLLQKIMEDETIGLVSGRIIYMEYQESIANAKKRFGDGFTSEKPFNKISFGCNPNAKFTGDIQVPVTHALFLTRKSLLQKFGYDPYYSKGNGYREETDFQIKAFLNGCKIVITNDTRCYHLSRLEIHKGGQRINRFWRLYWSVYYTEYFYDQYFEQIKQKLDIRYGKRTALIFFFVFQVFNLFINPLIKVPKLLIKRLFV